MDQLIHKIRSEISSAWRFRWWAMLTAWVVSLLGALIVAREMGSEAVVTTVFPDDNRKYLSTALFGDEPSRSDYLSSKVRLTGYDVLRRSCRTCTDAEECEHWPPG